MDREAIARLIDPVAFDAWQSLYDYGLTTAKFTPENALACANKFHGEERDAALAKADAILALTPPPGASPNPQEAEGWKLVPVEPTKAMLRAAGASPDGITPRGGIDWLGKMLPKYWSAMLAASPTPQEAQAEESGS